MPLPPPRKAGPQMPIQHVSHSASFQPFGLMINSDSCVNMVFKDAHLVKCRYDSSSTLHNHATTVMTVVAVMEASDNGCYPPTGSVVDARTLHCPEVSAVSAQLAVTARSTRPLYEATQLVAQPASYILQQSCALKPCARSPHRCPSHRHRDVHTILI